ncbi:MAG: M28 family metallopeptidase [Terriglobia bacterium]
MHKDSAAVLSLLAVFMLSSVPGSAAGGVTLHAAQLRRSVIEQRVENPPRANADREIALRAMFKASGCGGAEISEQIVRRSDPPNLICTMAGASPALIIVGGHLDHVRKGKGVVDDWSGASLLPSLYQSLHSVPRKHTFLFIGFTDEEKGLVGSEYYVGHLFHDRRRQIRAMVNLECLGMNPPEVWEDHADAQLLKDFTLVSRLLDIPLRGVDVENIGSDDAQSFRRRRIPTITIHSLTQDTVHILHSPADNFSAIHMPYYYETYRLAARYLAYLDCKLR